MKPLFCLFAAVTLYAQAPSGQTCTLLTQAHADASAGTPNINHDGTPLAGTPAVDISKGFQGIPRSAQPTLTPTQQRIWECTYHFADANADMPYTLFLPSSYRQGTPASLIVDLHGLNITPLQQILFDGTTDFAEKYGFIVLAPMGFSVSGGWGGRVGAPAAAGQTKSASELSELDAMAALKLVRERLTIDNDRIFLMGHSLGGAGTYYLGGKYNDIWAGLAPISGAGGIADAAAAEKYKSIPMLIMHGNKDSIKAGRDLTPGCPGIGSGRRSARLSRVSGDGSRVLDPPWCRPYGERVSLLQHAVEEDEYRVHYGGHGAGAGGPRPLEIHGRRQSGDTVGRGPVTGGRLRASKTTMPRMQSSQDAGSGVPLFPFCWEKAEWVGRLHQTATRRHLLRCKHCLLRLGMPTPSRTDRRNHSGAVRQPPASRTARLPGSGCL